ncbi:flavin-containing monooxygenase [Actinacidiphila epipremni]|uniref:NAD(P)-binding domain-containing protein n=1 Tax=Actinacidiphila epipremni TaxID=2053013 RepID=A0ABX0ZL39_9ACTN|nr:NAD(P)-binding domain-containing protein [Actinacidiphila epipremni]NJP43451.1 NAD(P)-binding domain-containing protein [Actinacidiphila epipremni]
MTTVDRSHAYCVIGAGAGGLAAAKNLKQFGFEADLIERADDVGGTWNGGNKHSAAYDSIHLITSKPYIQFDDFPIPADYPTYLGRAHAHAYLRAYAEHFGLYDRAEFHRTVERADRRDGSPHWYVTLDGGEVRRYGGLVIAHGHNWAPREPTYPGRFDGVVMHSRDYREPAALRGKRVLVVGGGTSGCDIAVEAAQTAAATYLSVRRGCYYWPKYLFGVPTDVLYENVLKWRLPRPLVRAFGHLFLRLNSAGRPQAYGLPKPAHKLLEEHFVINSTLLYALGHGDVAARPAIAELRGDRVLFTDGREEQIDVIVNATGYRMTEFPFIDRRHLNWTGRTPRLHLSAFHPDYDNLFLVGYFQTSTGNWPIMDYQAQITARYLHLLRTDPRKAVWFRKAKADPLTIDRLGGGIGYYDSERHWLQVEHFSYRALLRRTVRRLDATPQESAA